MPVKSKTWNTTPGLNFIQDSELAFATVYMVTREGLEYDVYVSGDTNRKHIFTASSGTIAFPDPFASGERVYALYKPAGSVDPEPVCEAVIEPVSGSLPDSINGQPYGQILAITGTPPFVITNVTKPAWMNITNSGNAITFSGVSNVEGVQTVEFDITNCGGTVTYSDTVNILPSATTFTIQNQVPGALITNLQNLNFVATSGLIYPPPFQTLTGVHDVYAGTPIITVTIGPFPFTIRFFINSIPIQNISVSASGSYTFTSVTSYNLSDDILIQLTP